MAVRYIFVPRSIVRPSPTLSSHGVSWSPDDLAIALGSGCGIIQPDAAKFHIAEPFVTTSIGIISKLACSVTVPDDTEVLRLRIRDTQGRVRDLRLLAGRDTSEWAHDCSDVLPLIQHRLAPIFRSYTVTRDHRECQGHDYVAVLPLGEAEGFALKEIEFTWASPSGAIVIHKVNLINERDGTTYALSPMERYLVGSDRWLHVKDVGGVSIYENLRAMPRAWLVSEVVSAGPEEVLQAIKTSRMPGERTFDPYKVALVEEPLVIEARHPDPTATAQVVRLDEGSVEVHTQSASPAFLVLSDIYYPGWRATIDGTATHIFQTNYILRGVMVPAGGHIVRFEYRPMSLYAGAGLGILSFLVLILVTFSRMARNRRKLADERRQAL